MDAQASHTAQAGTADQPTVLGEYQLAAEYTRRVAADVYEATHLPTGAPRRVYVLRPGAMQDSPFVHRVVYEADAARWIRHHAAARLEAYGDTPSRRLYVAVERPGGRPLDAMIAESGRLAPWRVVRLAGRIVEALSEAHAVGLVHGGLTPSAVIVAEDADGADASPTPVVGLLGLGTGAIDARDPRSEAEQAYISPEQLAGGEPDARSDVFGLASLLHHALTGVAPAGHPVGGASAAPAGEFAVHAVLARARAADPAGRPESVKAFWEDLLEALVADVVRATRATDDALTDGSYDGDDLGFDSAPIDEGTALAHLELSDFALADYAPPAAPAALPPAPVSADAATPPRRAGVPAPPAPAAAHDPALPLVEFSGVALSPPRPLPGDRRTAPTRRSEAPSPWAPAGTRAAAARPAASRSGTVGPRARTLLVHAWWLAVPAAAAALGWPMKRDAAGASDTASGPVAAAHAPRQRVTAPPVLETVTASRARVAETRHAGAAAGSLSHRDADASGVADEERPRTPAAPRFEMPAIYILTAPAPEAPAPAPRPLVRPEEFNTRIKIPGAPL